jgi:6-hydroxymethylpterin diphosphokinase MptE-like protein
MIQDFKDLHKGQTAVIIGNGPSLDQTPLEKFGYPTFAANKIYDSLAHPDFVPTYWTCVDQNMIHDCISWILSNPYPAEKFVPRDIPLKGAHQLNVVIESVFSKDASEKVVIGGTVTFVNLQLAYFMGFTTVLLVGVDHKYPKAASVGRPGHRFIAEGDDPDHFKARTGAYFTPGRIYNRPELSATEKYYAVARIAFEQAGRKIINLTPDTALNVFEKQEIAKWI